MHHCRLNMFFIVLIMEIYCFNSDVYYIINTAYDA